MVIEDMECLVVVGATSVSMHERFTKLAEKSPFQRAAPRRARRMSTNEGPLLSTNLRDKNRNQDIVDEVVQQLGLDWRVQELLQDQRSRAGSMPRSRASSVSRYGSQNEMPRLSRSSSWGNLSRANSVGNVSQRSGHSGRSHGGQSNHSRAMSFVGPDLNQRLQMRNAWMRRRNMRARGRGRARGGYIQRNQYRNQFQQQRGRWYNPQLRRQWQRGWQQGRQQWWRQQWGRQQWGRQQWGRLRRGGHAQGEVPPLTPRGRAGQENPGYVQKMGNAGRGRGSGRGRGAGRGRGRGGNNTGVSENGMPALKTLEQLDKELEEYMASTPALLDKQLDDYMAQSGISMDAD